MSLPEQPDEHRIYPGPRRPEAPLPPFEVHVRGLHVTIVPEGIEAVTTDSSASFATLRDHTNIRIGRRINEERTLKTKVQAGMQREVRFQFLNALDILSGKKEVPEIKGKDGQARQFVKITADEERLIKQWIQDGSNDRENLFTRLREVNGSDPYAPDPLRIRKITDDLRRLYVEQMKNGKLTGARNVTIDETTPHTAHLQDVTAVAFPLWSNAAPLLQEFASPLASVLFVVTKDGKLMFNVRQMKNANWKQVGGGIAGMMGYTTPTPTQDNVRSHIEKEGLEEAGLTKKDLYDPSSQENSGKSRIQLLGYAHSTKEATENRPRWEALGGAFLDEDSGTVRERVRSALQSSTANSRQDFAEGDVRILDATSTSIEKLVLFQNPWPTTHLAGLLALGYQLKYQELQAQGATSEAASTSAKMWVEAIAQAADHTYDRIDARVRDFYSVHPDIRERRLREGKNVEGYDPTIPPADVPDPKDPTKAIRGQGLPSVDEEIQRLFRV